MLVNVARVTISRTEKVPRAVWPIKGTVDRGRARSVTTTEGEQRWRVSKHNEVKLRRNGAERTDCSQRLALKCKCTQARSPHLPSTITRPISRRVSCNKPNKETYWLVWDGPLHHRQQLVSECTKLRCVHWWKEQWKWALLVNVPMIDWWSPDEPFWCDDTLKH